MSSKYKQLRTSNSFDREELKEQLDDGLGVLPKPAEVSADVRETRFLERMEATILMRAALTVVETRERVMLDDLEVARAGAGEPYVIASCTPAHEPGIHSLELAKNDDGTGSTLHYVVCGEGRFAILSSVDTQMKTLCGFSEENAGEYLKGAA